MWGGEVELHVNKGNSFLNCAPRDGITRGGMGAKIDVFQLRGHFVPHLRRRDNIDNIQNLFYHQLAGDQIGHQFLVFGERLCHLFPFKRGHLNQA